MKSFEQYTVDAFADRLFSGNPAAVTLLDQWLSDHLLLAIAQENNLSETAFLVKTDDSYHLRWFTPGGEIDLCGHATLAAAYVLMTYVIPDSTRVSFETKSGILTVEKTEVGFQMDFPAYDIKEVEVTQSMIEALGQKPVKAFMGRDLVLVLEDEESVLNYQPNLESLEKLDGLLVHVTSQASHYDCVSRSFAPKLGISEDPVCGSGHCHLFPYWAKELAKANLVGYQASSRGGVLHGQVKDDRVYLSGQAQTFAISKIFVDDQGSEK